MLDLSGNIFSSFGILAVFILVFANGFFVAAEFALVSVRRSRVAELAADGMKNAKALQRSTNNLDASLAATQLGITISSLALGWIGEPALAHVIEPLLRLLPQSVAAAGAHAIAVAVSFVIITALHIVLGELAPKSLALQCSEKTALWVVRPLQLFQFFFHPIILTLNNLGNFVLRKAGLQSGTGEESIHSPEELKLLIQESQEAGFLHQEQQDVVVRVLNIGERPISDIMTPRPLVEWINANNDKDEMLKTICESSHDQLLVCRGNIDDLLGMILKKDILEQVLHGQAFDPLAIIRKPLIVSEMTPIFKVLEQFKQVPVWLAIIVNEYGNFEGIVTQTDFLEMIAGDLPDIEEEPGIVEREDGSFLVGGMVSIFEMFDLLDIKQRRMKRKFHTIAGLALEQLGRLPSVGESFLYDGWYFEIVDMDGPRIDKFLVRKQPAGEQQGTL